MAGVIRRAAAGDLDALVELAREYCEADGHVFDEQLVRAGFGPLLVDDTHGVVWVADESGIIGGYAVVTWSWSIESGGRDALLDEIYVRDAGRGVGSALVAHLLADCRARGLPRIFLETEAANDDARRLYARLGFETETSIWMTKNV